MADTFKSSRAAPPVGAYPHARRIGNLLFLSGVGPRGLDSSIPAGIEAQTHAVFANVRAILEDSGSGWDRLVDVTVFLTDMKADFPTYNRLWAQ
ncbi:MAG: RidA family protein, partial [Acidimicrobiia bacterium]